MTDRFRLLALAAAATIAAGGAGAQSPQELLRMIERSTGGAPGAGQVAIPGMPGIGAIPVSPAEVLHLQTLLNRAGYDVGRPDGVLGPATMRAAARFQQSLGHPPTGLLTPEEIRSLEARAGAASPAPAVPVDAARVQRLLLEAGYDPGAPDGRWGPRSQRALESFRQSRGLAAFGPPTWDDIAALENPVAPPAALPPPPDTASIDFTSEGPAGQTLTALPVMDREAVFRVAWTGPAGDHFWIAVIAPGAAPTPGIPAWPRGAASPTRIQAPAAPGLYEIVLIDVRDGTVVLRRPLEVL